MSSLPRRRRVKKPTILVKRSQLAKNNVFNKRSYKPLYEKLKANNNALAKALSSEKQESQYLFSQNIALTSDVQELRVACNRRDDIISGVLKNAKETLQLMVTLSTYVTNTIASCQQVVTTTRFTPRKSSVNNRRDSTRRLSGKSPARGVVQPMVSGHTITKPTINLSRLNIQREYRVQNPSNLSNIEEVLSPSQSPSAAESTTPVRIPIARPLNYAASRVNRLPERFRASIRVSDESERRSSVRSNRNSARHSGRRSRGTSERLFESSPPQRSSEELQAEERLRSPRVALHDVSRLLQNSQSVNIRTLLESSSDMEFTHSQQDPAMEISSDNIAPPKPEGIVAETSDDPETDSSDTPPVCEASKSKSSGKKCKIPPSSDVEDPLEGPSWLLNEIESASFFSENDVTTTVNSSAPQANAKDHGRSKHRAINEEEEDDEEEEAEGEGMKSTDDDDHDHEKSEKKTVNLTVRRSDEPINFYRHLDDDDCKTTMNVARFVTQKRGSTCDGCDEDMDDFTMLWKRPGPPKNYDFDINDLELPVLESPIVAAAEPRAMEPESTTTIQRITQTMGGFAPACPRAHGEETIYDHTGLVLPIITENADSIRASTVVEQEEHSDEGEIVLGKRKRQYKRRVLVDSPSDSDWVPTPERKSGKLRRKTSKAKDPSSAKVVLQKLNETDVKKRATSTESQPRQESRHQRSTSTQRGDASSDSEGSNASSTAKNVQSSRPRRQKAPKNLQEPSLAKKLRRN